MIGLKFLLTGGQFFITFLPEQDANQILAKWIKGEYELNGPSRIGKILPAGSWVIDIKSIIAIHTVTLEELQAQQPQPQQKVGGETSPTTPGPMTSGVAAPMHQWKP